MVCNLLQSSRHGARGRWGYNGGEQGRVDGHDRRAMCVSVIRAPILTCALAFAEVRGERSLHDADTREIPTVPVQSARHLRLVCRRDGPKAGNWDWD